MCSIKNFSEFPGRGLAASDAYFLKPRTACNSCQLTESWVILRFFAPSIAAGSAKVFANAVRSAAGGWRAGGAIQPRPRTMLPAVSYAICWSCGSVTTSLRKGASGRSDSGAVALAASKLTSGTRYERAIVKAERDDWKP